MGLAKTYVKRYKIYLRVSVITLSSFINTVNHLHPSLMFQGMALTREVKVKGRFSTVALTSLYQLLFMLKSYLPILINKPP